MDKTAQALIQKLASKLTSKARSHLGAGEFAEPGERKYPIEDKAHARNALARVSQHGSSGEKATVRSKVHSKYPDIGEKGASMKAIIDDIIKGAEQNTFGRPVNIQAQTDWTHFDTAKVAGALAALEEKGYSVKEAAEYLGLTEGQIQDIVSTVR